MNYIFKLAADGAAEQSIFQTFFPIIAMVGVLVVMYFFTIRPNRKKDKALKEQLSKMAVGDSIVTIGGIVGTIANIKDDEVTISTSVAHTMMTFKKNAINTVTKRESN